MADLSEQVDTILAAAVELASEDERASYIQTACCGDEKLRQQVEELVEAYFSAGRFLDAPALAITACMGPEGEELPGAHIGRYKLLQKIGEGGMGVVFMAEQEHPVRRTVALKIIKPGLDSRQVVARLEAERQALAMMDHPSIAKVLDAGATDAGRPYFVMELVKGVPITKYCDDHRLPLRERLELARLVCEAVQHAHQKGIIHRDLKPTNILVAEYDNRPVPKVIDFGVAKATAQSLTDRTMFTEFGQVIGTVEYMSPEQAKLNQLDIDTRSDIYSLGVLLYELLAGSTPFEHERLREAAFDEVLRIIREDEPPKPSTRLSTSATMPSIAASRRCEPTRLSKDVRGELDWIVMKCLEKDRNRRYQTANGLANDLRRYLNNEPVAACPPSVTYRLRKFARRNRIGVLSGLVAVSALAFAAVASLVSLAEVRRESARKEAALRQRAIALKEKEMALELRQVAFQLAETDPKSGWNRLAMLELLRRESESHSVEGDESAQDRVVLAIKMQKDFIADNPPDTHQQLHLAVLCYWFGQDDENLSLCRKALADFHGSAEASDYDRAAKGYLIRPDAALHPDLLKQAVAASHQALELSTGFGIQPWCQFCAGMAAFRSGKNDEAERMVSAACETTLASRTVRATALLFRAMIRFRDGRRDEAQSDFAAAEQLMPPPAPTRLKVSNAIMDHDTMIYWLAHEEATALMSPAK